MASASLHTTGDKLMRRDLWALGTAVEIQNI